MLLVAATLAGVLVSELLYRGKLWLDLSSKSAGRDYNVLNKPLTQFDQDFGYSFSSNPNQPLGWPHFFARDTGFQVHNFARAGYGLLQMIHLAAAKTRELHPDFIIVAFIMEDLIRDRTWHSTINIDGQPTPVMATDPISLNNPNTTMETALIEPGITSEWCQQQQTAPNPTDPLLTRITQRHRSLAARRHKAFLLNPTQSLLLNRLKHQDPYHGLRTPTLTPRTTMTSFEEDAAFVRDIQSITIPMYLIVLPKHNELIHQNPQASQPMISLIQSLQRLSGISPKFLMGYMDITGVVIESYYLLPEDQHPSVVGSAAFAKAIVGVVNGRPETANAQSQD